MTIRLGDVNRHIQSQGFMQCSNFAGSFCRICTVDVPEISTSISSDVLQLDIGSSARKRTRNSLPHQRSTY